MSANDTPAAPPTQPPKPAPTPALTARLSGAAMDRRIERSRWKRPRTLWIAGGVAAVAAAGVLAFLFAPPPGSLSVKAAEVEVSPVQSAPFRDYLPVRAAIEPLRTVIVGAVSGGQVEAILVADGQEVAAQTPLATLSNSQLRLDVTAREAEISGRLGDVSAQQLSLQRNRIDREREIAETNYNLLKSRRELDIRQRLHEQGFVSDAGVKTFADETGYYQSRLDALKRGRATEDAFAGAHAAQIRATGAQLRSNLGVVRSTLQALVLRAPVAGRLTAFTLQPGQTLKAGDPVGQIDSEGAYKLVADIDEFYLGRVSPGQAGTAELDGRPAPVVVARVLPQVKEGRFRAELEFRSAPGAPLRRGQTLDLKITLGDTRPALVLPNGPWLQAGGGGFAFVVDGSGRRAERRTISVGRRNPEQVEVTSGLRPGERVVTSAYTGFDKFNRLILR